LHTFIWGLILGAATLIAAALLSAPG
jgi:hypothetical protein